MSEENQKANPESIEIANEALMGFPVATIRRQRLSWAWLVPVIALGAVAYLAWAQVAGKQGERVIIRFADASGIRQGTAMMYRGVQVGVVQAIELDHELGGVLVHSELIPSAGALAVEGTEFWVVLPELSLTGSAGLETLLGPNYIAIRPGEYADDLQPTPKHSFVALDQRPVAALPTDGSLHLQLTSDRLGTLAPGNPVLYREIRVGTVREAKLSSDSRQVLIELDIEPRYRVLIHENTKFWRSGGVGFNVGFFTGVSVKADSLEDAMVSSISFATPSKKAGGLATPGDVFELADGVGGDWLKWSPEIELGGDD